MAAVLYPGLREFCCSFSCWPNFRCVISKPELIVEAEETVNNRELFREKLNALEWHIFQERVEAYYKNGLIEKQNKK